jgi:hypothetical protein
MARRPCPSCGSEFCNLFYEVRRAPTSSQGLFSSRSEAIALARGSIELALCSACGFVFNAAFDASMATLSAAHEERPPFGAFEVFEHHLADQLAYRFALRDKHILEIGGGGGDFLGSLCRLGGNQGARIAPGNLPMSGDSLFAGRTAIGPEPLTAQGVSEPIDLVCMRMVLERIADPARLVRGVHRALSHEQHGRLFLQVPDLMRTLRRVAFWEIHYEHCSYFSPGALRHLLSAQGFTVGDMWTELDGQLLMVDARARADGPGAVSTGEILEPAAALGDLVARFTRECQQKQALWCEILRDMASAGNRIIVWGTGPRTVSFLTTLAMGHEIGWVVDPDPRRQGKYLPGTGHLIVGPEVVAALRPEVMIVMNWIYTSDLQELLGSVGCTPALLIA